MAIYCVWVGTVFHCEIFCDAFLKILCGYKWQGRLLRGVQIA